MHLARVPQWMISQNSRIILGNPPSSIPFVLKSMSMSQLQCSKYDLLLASKLALYPLIGLNTLTSLLRWFTTWEFLASSSFVKILTFWFCRAIFLKELFKELKLVCEINFFMASSKSLFILVLFNNIHSHVIVLRLIFLVIPFNPILIIIGFKRVLEV